MLGNAVRQHSRPATTKVQKPLQPSHAASNAPKTLQSNKRKFDRSLSGSSNLNALHNGVFFDENDFDDDAAIDLSVDDPPLKRQDNGPPPLNHSVSDSSHTKPSTTQPPSTLLTSSSAPIPWSSSPPEHHQPPSKRRTLPWLDNDRNDISLSNHLHDQKPGLGKASHGRNGTSKHYTPLPKDLPNKPSYPWNNTASSIKDKQKELRQRNKDRAKLSKDAPGSPTKVSRSAAKVPPVFLSDEQKGVLKTVVEDGKSVFFTGSAGTGKSVLMRQIIKQLKSKYKNEPDRVAVTASTGLAACNIEGLTLHSFGGLGLAKEPAPELVKKVKKNRNAKSRWQRTKVLIIDEISMVDADLFDKLEQIARSLRGNGRPFGGLQVVVTGDFFQLPPVPERNRVSKFAFAAQSWNTVIEHTILLNHVFRQKDPEFASILNDMRLGKMTPNANKLFKDLARPLSFEDDLDASELFPTKAEVDRANKDRMDRLSGEVYTFRSRDTGAGDPQQVDNHLKHCIAPPMLEFKKGAQVMLIKNMDGTLVNGSLGRIVAFQDETMFKFYVEDEDSYLDANDSRPDDDGSPERAEIKQRARAKLQAFRNKNTTNANSSADSTMYPMVRFTMPDGTTRDMLCVPEQWKVESPRGEILASRSQVPLILAWALSIHKAQGQTLARVKVNLNKTFEKGQAYVAISRAVNKSGLQVLNYEPRKIMVAPDVTRFYEQLVSVSEINKAKAARRGAGGKGTITAKDYEERFVDLEDEEGLGLGHGHGQGAEDGELDEELAYAYG